MPQQKSYDVVIVGAGLAGSIAAYKLGSAGKKVLILESGVGMPASREAYMERFYLELAKTPESPYPDNPNASRATVLQLTSKGDWKEPAKKYLDQSESTLPFSSTYERRAGGTSWHWLGSSFRFLPHDFKLLSTYGHGRDWPIDYTDLGLPQPGRAGAYYDAAEQEIGVSADAADQTYLGVTFTPGYQYPNPSLPLTLTDQFFADVIDGKQVFDNQTVSVKPAPAGRNSRPYDNRRVCAGNTNCIPICPIQAKYDPTVTLAKALFTGNVDVLYQAVADNVVLDDANQAVVGIHYITYSKEGVRSPSGEGIAVGAIYLIAAHAIETPKLLLHSNDQLPQGVANRSGQVGCNLMDHPLFLRWGLTPTPTWPYRGPLATAGIESLRDGGFRKDRAAWRVEFGNEGWNFAAFDPGNTTLDFIEGSNNTGTNPQQERLFGAPLVQRLNDLFTRQFRFGFLVEQSPEDRNRVTLSPLKDDLGIPRPMIHYDLSDYTKRGFVAAETFAKQIFDAAKVTDFSAINRTAPGYFTYTDPSTGQLHEFEYHGSGHIVGTCRMGDSPTDSVVDRLQRSWEHPNLFITGSSVFPTIATGNPSLTIAALAFWVADTILEQLSNPTPR